MEDNASELKTARVTQLHDSSGKLQAIYNKFDLLDIAAITKKIKRRVEPVAHYNVDGDPLVRSNAYTTIIDNSLMDGKHVEIRSNAESEYKTYLSTVFRDQFTGPLHFFADIVIPIDNIPAPTMNHEDDESQMLSALGRFQSIRLKQRLEETLEFPPLPASSQRIIQLCSKENAGTDELCKVISLDPSLAAQVVSWASSPYYGAPGEIESVEDAIIRVLGFDMVMNLALGLSMGSAFSIPKEGPRHYNDFWYNAVLYASLMEALVKKMPPKFRPRLGHAYLSGLLHNFGYLAISYILPPHFKLLSRYLEANAHIPSEYVEMHLLRFTKEQLGSWLLRQWGIPESICTAIRYAKSLHYEGESRVLASLLRVCHSMIHNHPLDNHIESIIGMPEADCIAVYKKILSSTDNLNDMVDLIKNKAN